MPVVAKGGVYCSFLSPPQHHLCSVSLFKANFNLCGFLPFSLNTKSCILNPFSMAINSDVPSTARPPTQPQDVQKQQPASHLTIKPLPSSLRKDTWLGAEVLLPPQNPLLNPTTLSPADTSTLQQALYDHGVLVIRKQQDIDPLSLEKLAAIWDPDMINVHSAGKDQVRDPSSILSRNNGARLPGAQNVQIIGNGVFEYQGMELDLRHVVSVSFQCSG